MAIVRIGKYDRRYVHLVVSNRRGGQSSIYQAPGDLQTVRRHRRCGGRKASDPFLMNCVGPPRFDQAIDRGLDKDISQMERIEDAGVEDRNRRFKRHNAA